MANDCRDIIMSEDYADFIDAWNISTTITPEEEDLFCINSLGSALFSYHVPLPRNRRVDLREHRYLMFPKLYGLMDTLSLEASEIISVRNQPVLGLTGQNVIIGIIDTGERVIIMLS